MYARRNTLKEKIEAGETVIGMEVWLRDPRVVELLGQAGFDFIHLEYEHVARDWSEIENLVRAAELYGMQVVFRTEQCINGEPPRNQIIKAMKTGVHAVMIPHMETKEEAQAAVNAVKFVPWGGRGIATCDRSAWEIPDATTLDVQQYSADLNSQTMVWAIIESPKGVENIDEILSVDGLDVVGFGHQDYSLAAGIGSDDSAAMKEARDKVWEAVQRHGKQMWWNAGGADDFVDEMERGFKIGMLCVDLIHLNSLFRQFRKTVTEAGRG